MSRFERILWRDLLPRSPVFTTAEAASVAEVAPSMASRSYDPTNLFRLNANVQPTV